MQIEIYKKRVYSEVRVYVKDEDTASSIKKLTGCATLTANHQDAFAELGIELVLVPDPELNS